MKTNCIKLFTAIFFAMITLIGLSSAQAEGAKTKPTFPALGNTKDKDLGFSKLTPAEKKAIVESYFTEDDHSNFFSLLSFVKKDDQIYLKKAFAEKGNLESLLAIGKYMKSTIETFNKLVDERTTNEDTRNTMKSALGNAMLTVLDPITPEIKIVAKANFKELWQYFKKTVMEAKTMKDDGTQMGALFSLTTLGEEAFENILASVKTETDAKIVFGISQLFKEGAVIPTLKYFEQPNLERYQRDMATEIIRRFPIEIKSVVDKIAEAVMHGRYVEIKQKEMTIEEMRIAALNWWGLILNQTLRGKDEATTYIAKTYLTKAKGEAKANLINLLCMVDFKTSAKCLLDMEIEKLPEETVSSILYSCIINPTDEEVDPDLDLKYDIFCKIVMRFKSDLRKDSLRAGSKFPPEKMATFYIKNFDKFTDDEKEIIIFNCGKNLHETGEFPKELRKKVFAVIEPKCNEKQKKIIGYVKIDVD